MDNIEDTRRSAAPKYREDYELEESLKDAAAQAADDYFEDWE